MSHEKSVLTEETIQCLISEKYGKAKLTVLPMPMGTANCYKLSDGSNSYFLKEFQSRFNESDLQREVKLTDYLIDHGYPTEKNIALVNGDRYFSYRERFILMQEFFDGKIYCDNNLPSHLLMQAAELLGKLHSLLADYDLPTDMGADWVNSFSPENSAKQYDELLAVLESNPAEKHYKRIKSDLLYKKQLVYKISGYGQYFDKLTYCATHGDFTCFQYICDDEKIKAIIDFSSARRLPVVWELMRSYTQSCAACRSGKELDTSEFEDYVGHYLRFFSLKKDDLTYMPYVYLYQLARSKYGYKEYLITKTENKNDLLNFAFWRTDICREIEQRKVEISNQLCNRFEVNLP